MPDDGDDRPRNPFVRWKQNVDAHVGLALNGLFGIPSMVSKNFGFARPDAQAARPDSPSSPRDACSCGREYPRDGEPGGGRAADSSRCRYPRRHRARGSSDVFDRDPEQLAEQFAEWHAFISSSPYSPLRLQHLPPPIPRDMPPGQAAGAVSFAHAFEDLLAASSDQPMMDLRGAHVHPGSRFVGDMHTWFFWLQRRGLLDAYFPPSSTRAAAAERERERWVGSGSQADGDTSGDWGRRAARAYRAEEEASDPPSDPAREPGSLFDELDRLFKALEKREAEDNPTTTTTTHEDGPNEPATEDDLYSAVRSAFADNEKSITSFLKVLLDGRFSGGAATSFSKVSENDSTASPAEESGTTVKTTTEHVDSLGFRHVQTVVTRLNADGEEIGKEIHRSITSPPPPPAEVDEMEDESAPQLPRDEKPAKAADGQKKDGWFWK